MFYDYECHNCGNVFEREEPSTAPTQTTCPACMGEATRLIPLSVGVIFKGPGFYSTDYRKRVRNGRTDTTTQITD